MNNCKKISDLISSYADGEVTADEKLLLEEHILHCQECKKKLDFILKTKDVLKNSPIAPVPETLLVDFEKYKEKHTLEEKKVIPFYKNYRMYASIAAIFVFAFVLKSGLWQEEKYMPESESLDNHAGETIIAPLIAEEQAVPSVQPKSSNSAKVSKKEAAIQQNSATTPEPAEVLSPVADKDVSDPSKISDLQSDEQTHLPSSGDNNAVSSDVVPDYTRTTENTDTSGDTSPQAAQDAAPEIITDAQIYVSEQYLQRATELLSDNYYLLFQAEQKLEDSNIPFESNFLLLDEGKQYKITVSVKNEE